MYIRYAMIKYEVYIPAQGTAQKTGGSAERKRQLPMKRYGCHQCFPYYFLDSAFDKIVNEDRAFSHPEGQTISQPYTVAYQHNYTDQKKMIRF